MSEHNEHFTPGPWASHQMVVETTKNGQRQIVATTREWEDARLIAEAPVMFALLKEFLEQHTGLEGDFHCPCYECKAARAIIAHVEGK